MDFVVTTVCVYLPIVSTLSAYRHQLTKHCVKIYCNTYLGQHNITK